MLTRQVLLTKVIHVLNQVQNKTALIHYFYKAIMNDSLACDLFSKNYEPFTSLLVLWKSFDFWFVVVFSGGLVPRENDLILLLHTQYFWELPSPSSVTDDHTKQSSSAAGRAVQLLTDHHLNTRHSLRKAQQKTLMAEFGTYFLQHSLSSKGQWSSHKKLQIQSFCWHMPSVPAELHSKGI